MRTSSLSRRSCWDRTCRRQGYANLDPDSEVVYDGKTYRVIDSDGHKARISSATHTITVDAARLSRGRTEHANTWNYGETDRGFDREVKSPLHKGMWIWVRSRPSTVKEYPQSYRELGCIRILNGSHVDGYYALDGARFSVFEGDIEVAPPEQPGMHQISAFDRVRRQNT